MKPLFPICVLIIALTACSSLNTELPADFPADVPIIQGDIYRAQRTKFEDGPGFVVDVLTTSSCEEVREFYRDIIGPREDGEVRVETSCGDSESRYVSIAVHLGGVAGLNPEQYARQRALRPSSGLVELVEKNKDQHQ